MGLHGPAQGKAGFTPPVFQPTPDIKISISKVVVDCNWAQILEGWIDSAHSSSLHSTDMVPARTGGAEATDKLWLRPSTDEAPRLQVQPTPIGFRYAAIRRPIKDAKTHDYICTTLFIAPYTVQISPHNLYEIATTEPRILNHKLSSFQGEVPKETDWRQLGTAPRKNGCIARHRKFSPRAK
ncbi:hypothetical protein [Billgrantia sulfidoxydans]|uniref:hypothetical protein n=1 Tax=Billgrantia sulfidoxydans TaxID=2733484 RepID=UPI001F5EA8F2|nr:hypothetical protein [Halomonas sulfidoxydans]